MNNKYFFLKLVTLMIAILINISCNKKKNNNSKYNSNKVTLQKQISGSKEEKIKEFGEENQEYINEEVDKNEVNKKEKEDTEEYLKDTSQKADTTKTQDQVEISKDDNSKNENTNSTNANHFELAYCRSKLFHKRQEITKWPKNYTPLKPKNERTQCADEIITRARNEANTPEVSALKARKLATVLGVGKKNSDTSCKIKNVYVLYTPFKPFIFRNWGGSIRQSRNLIYEKCSKTKDLNVKSHKDRMAYVHFGTESTNFWHKYVKWDEGIKKIVDKVNDLSVETKETQNVYPKVMLQMVQYITYIYDKSYDKEATKYTISKNHGELLNSMKNAKPYIDSKNKNVPHMKERILKTFKYIAPITNYCKNTFNRHDRHRDIFLFFANNDECSDNSFTFPYIHDLMNKGRKLKGIYNIGTARRIIEIKKKNCNCTKKETLAVCDFVWRITVKYKDKNGQIKTMIHENEIDKLFA